MKKCATNLILGLFVLCAYTDPVWDQFADRLLAGQIMYSASHLQGYEDYIKNISYANIPEYRRECNWGFYFRVQKETKTPNFGVVIKF